MIGRRWIRWLAGGRAPWEKKPKPMTAEEREQLCATPLMGGGPLEMYTDDLGNDYSLAERQEVPAQFKHNLMYVRELKTKRQLGQKHGIPPLTAEQEERHLRLVELRNRVDAFDTSTGHVHDIKMNRHE